MNIFLSSRLKQLTKQGLIGLILLLPPIIVLGLLMRLTINVPYWDEWSLVPLIVKLHKGGFTFEDFWIQHNEHRILFPRLIMLALAYLSGWNVSLEVYASFALALLSGIILWKLLKITLQPSQVLLQIPVAFVISLLVFSLAQGQNWIWGWQLTWFLSNFCVIFGIWVFARWPGQWWSLVASALAALGATYSLASGQILWGTIFLGLIFQRRTWSMKMIGFWLMVTALAVGSYLYNYHSVGGHPSIFYLLDHPLNFAIYCLAYLGSPLGSWGGFLSVASPIYGLVGLLGLGVMLSWLLWLRADIIAKVLPWLQLILFAIANALITGVGRAGFGVGQALSSRYVTVAILFWIGLCVLCGISLREFFLRRHLFGRLGTVAGLACLMVLMLRGYLQSYLFGYTEIRTLSGQLKTALPFLYQYETSPDAPLLFLFPNSTIVREQAKILASLQAGPFASEAAAENRLRLDDDGGMSRLHEIGYDVRYAYPSTLINMSFGDKSTLTSLDNTLLFSNSSPEGSNFYVDAAILQQLEQKSKFSKLFPFVVDIQSKNAFYVNVYWNTGAGLSEREKSTLYVLETSEGWKHFRCLLWRSIQGFRVDLHYPSNEPLSDGLKIDIYASRWP